MANLTSYNSLAEAIAFNLTDENLEELGYTNFNGLTKGIHSNKFTENAVIPPKNVLYRRGLYEDTQKFKVIDYKQMEFDSLENILQTGKTLNSITPLKDKNTREIDTTNYYLWKSSTGIDAGVVNGTYTGFYCDIKNDITKMPFFGNFDEPNYRACLYDSFKTEYKTLVGLRNRLAEEGVFFYSPLTDFRYLDNKKVIKVSELIDGSFLGMINLIPNNTIGFVYKDTNYAGNVDTNNQYDQFCADILNGKDIVSSYDKVQAFEAKYSGKYTIYYRTANVLYFGNLDDVSITGMFVNDNTGLDYPLTESGYIDYKNIDYSKTYTTALGAAKVSPKIISKMLGWSWMNVDAFTNEPKDDTQGVATKISITNQVFRPSDNTATITITLGYTEINGTRYNDELQPLYSANQYINIETVNDTTYKVSFRNTTNPQTDFVYIPIKNTYTGVVIDNFYELELVRDDVTEVVRLRQSKYEVTISNCKTISGYVYYERKTALTTDEKNNLKQADITKAFEFFNTNIVSFPRLTPFDPTEIKSITFGDRNVMCIFKGKALAKNEQYRVGTYHYDIKSIGSNIQSSLDVILCADASDGTQDPGTGNPPNNPNKKPIGGTVNPGSGGNGSGGIGGGGTGSSSNKGSMMDDDTNKFEKDLNSDPKKESLTTPNGDSCIIPKTDNEYVDLSELFEFADSEVTVTSDPIFTDETLIGLGGQGDGSVILSRNYQGGTVWTYPTTDDAGNRHLGTIITNDSGLIPKIRTYVTVKAKYKRANAKGEGTDSSGNRVLATFVFWQYAQSFTLVNSTTNPTESVDIVGGDTSTYHPTVTDIFKLTWNKHNDYNPTLTEDDVILNYNGDPSNISIKVKWKWDGVGLTPNEGKIAIKDIVNICAYTEGLEADQLRELYNIPESNNFTLTDAPTGSTLDENNFNVTFTSNGYLSFTLDYGNTKPDLYGTFDIKTTITDVNNLSYAIEGKNYDIKWAYKTRDVYVNTNAVKTAEPTFDLTQIKKVNLEVTEVRDFMGTVIPPKGA